MRYLLLFTVSLDGNSFNEQIEFTPRAGQTPEEAAREKFRTGLNEDTRRCLRHSVKPRMAIVHEIVDLS